MIDPEPPRESGTNRMPLPFDSIYFMMFAGWRSEGYCNRWIYAQRWARHVPVILVQPERPPAGGWSHEAEPRLPNTEILSIRENADSAGPSIEEGAAEARQIISFMRRRNHRRPLLWFYNPYLTFAYALIPAVFRVFHATENYFDFDMQGDDFINLTKAAIAISDKVICCSGGVLDGVRAATGRDGLELIPNGCDYRFYTEPKPAKGDWMARLQPVLARGAPIAVFAGGINLRMDFALMLRLAAELCDVHFVYAGPVDHDWLEPVDRASWATLLRRPNVTYLGVLDGADLPLLYSVADRGFIPYRHLPFLVKDGFPLKALEMAAAGLPVVASLMEPLLAMQDAVEVVGDNDAFLSRLRVASRRTRSAEAAARADAVCRAYDYDRAFARVLEMILPAVSKGPPRPAELALVYDRIGPGRAFRDDEPGPSRTNMPTGAPEFSAGARGVPRIVATALRHLRAEPPPGLSFCRRILWHIPPQFAARVPFKSALKRSLRL
jgi:glycosyltransferase involved in cell wall biosynthesis